MIAQLVRLGSSLLGLGLCTAVSQAQSVWIVDDGPNGADFTDIQSAVDAAQNGDVILVLPGRYASFTIDGKALRVTSERGGLVEIDADATDSAVVVRNVPSNQVVTLRGLDFRTEGRRIHDEAPLVVENSPGRVWVEDSRITRERISTQAPTARAVGVRNTNAAIFVRCEIEGGVLFEDSDASLYESFVTGNDAGSSLGPPDGGPGITIDGGTVFVAGALVRGGAGRNNTSTGACDIGNGGPGLELSGSSPLVALLNVALAGGAGGLDLSAGGICGGNGSAGPQQRVLSGSVIPVGGMFRSASSSALALEGEGPRLHFEGKSGDAILGASALGTAYQVMQNLNGISILNSPSIFMNRTLSGSTLDLALPASVLPPAQHSEINYVQAAFLGQGGQAYLSTPSSWVVADLEDATAGGQDCDNNGTNDLWDILQGNVRDDDADGIPNPCDSSQIIWVDDDAPNDPGPGDPLVSDPLEDGTPNHPFDAIQEAVASATPTPYTTVIVKDGIYTGFGNRDIDFAGVDMTVRSENGPTNCLINCEDLGRGFWFHSGETPSAQVRGIWILNGLAFRGGAILAENSSPTIRGCVIDRNKAATTNLSAGGGIAAMNSGIAVIDTQFLFNSTIGSGEILTAGGGGFFYDETDPPPGTLRRAPTIVGCLFEGNQATLGGGMTLVSTTVTPLVSECYFLQNASSEAGGLHVDGKARIENCHIVQNKAQGFPPLGGGVDLNGGEVTLFGCTIADNIGDEGAGIRARNGSVLEVNGCILWGNRNGKEIDMIGGELDLSYTDVQNGGPAILLTGGTKLTVGPGIIAADPLFAGAAFEDYHLLPGSPCLDAGDPSYVPRFLEHDFDGEKRIKNGVIDIGADER